MKPSLLSQINLIKLENLTDLQGNKTKQQQQKLYFILPKSGTVVTCLDGRINQQPITFIACLHLFFLLSALSVWISLLYLPVKS